MSTRMLIDARHSEETRVAIIKGNRVEEFDYESAARRQLKGNIYLAKVMRVEPSLQACFVDYGGNRHGFLAFSEIHPDYYQIPVADREALKSEDAQAVEDDSTDSEESGDDPDVERISGELDYESMQRRRTGALRHKYKIQEVIKKRQILLVQVVKEERGTKGAALTTYLSLAGRYCVLMPNSPDAGGISRKIANQTDRKKLKSLMSALEVPDSMGCIIRTAGQSRTRAEIKRDLDYLIRLWSDIRELTLKSVAPALIHEEANLIKRSIRDLYTREIEEVLVEGENGYRIAKTFMKLLMPSHARRVQHYKDRIPLFHRFQVEQQLESMYSPLVQLNSGGYIVINPTEALVAIDVNSGRSTREHNIEETAFKTNLEAAEEIARQLRLRDMAGLVVIDFIDMEDRGNNRAVEKRLKDALKNDRARIQVSRVSSFGLIEMTRQRLRPNLLEASMEVCPQCRGTGVVRSTESAALAILRALEEEGIRDRSGEVTIHAPQAVAIYLLNRKRLELADLEQRHSMAILINAAGNLDGEPWRMDRVAREDVDHVPAPPETPALETAAREVEGEDADARQADDDRRRDRHQDESQDEESQKKRRPRRRGGRRNRTRDTSDQAEQTAEATGTSAPDTPAASTDSPGGDTADRPSRRRRRRKPARQDEGATAHEVTAIPADADAAAPSDSASEDAAPQATDEPATDKPKRSGRSRGGRGRKRKPAGTESQDTGATREAASETPASSAPAEAEDTQAAADEKPKRPRRRRKTAPKDDAVETAAETAEATGDETAPAEPPAQAAGPEPVEAETKKPVRRRRKTPAKAPAKAKAETEPAANAETATADTAASSAVTDARPAGETIAEAPVERVVVPEDGQPEAAPADASANSGKRRKGWWQRALGK